MKRINILIVLFVTCVNVYSQEVVSDENNTLEYSSFGENINTKKMISFDMALEKYQKLKVSDTIKVKFSATVSDVCKAKGCWMKLDVEGKQEVMVRFKDYGFFMPKDIEGKEVVVSGYAFVEEMSVQDQQHYAKDSGKSEEEIAKITKTKKTYGFMAEGVLLKK
ncbi:DUF4920 domain-containing protein [uncultured Maribacter sp.]|uniref:DUF4920 domain-containing protein n=1 Tax=uncultured Maribacter sp. TaxID=431308 RepID=UPI002629F7DE|nr:DUF4920 domain-containing protein [uncultured Maribacter sp.]